MLSPVRTFENDSDLNAFALASETSRNGDAHGVHETGGPSTTQLESASSSPDCDANSTTAPPIDLEVRSPLPEGVSSPEATKMIKGELQRVLNSKTFSKAPRLKRFLEYVVLRALAGEHKALKEYTLGLEVFDRLPSFDPSSDPIVRVEASRLRSRLSVYYSTEGAAGSVRIDVPKGRYTPIVRPVAADHTEKPSIAEFRDKTIIILPFSLLGSHRDYGCAQVDALSGQLSHLLTQSSEARVLSRISSVQSKPGMDARELGKHYGVQYIVEGSVILAPDEYRVLTYLVGSAHGYNLWSGCYELNLNKSIDTAHQVAVDLLSVLHVHAENRVDGSKCVC